MIGVGEKFSDESGFGSVVSEYAICSDDGRVPHDSSFSFLGPITNPRRPLGNSLIVPLDECPVTGNRVFAG